MRMTEIVPWCVQWQTISGAVGVSTCLCGRCAAVGSCVSVAGCTRRVCYTSANPESAMIEADAASGVKG